MRSFGIGVDDCTKRHMIPSDKIGGQCIKINDQEFGMNVNLDYFRAQKPTTKNLTKYPIVEIASPLPYEPQRRYSRYLDTTKVYIDDWRAHLSFPTYKVTKLTILNTTHLVNTLQSETNEYTKDHYKTRVCKIRPRCIDYGMYSDTFFSSVCSIRVNTYFQIFAYKRSKYEKIALMHQEY